MSIMLLGQSDRIMIKYYCGDDKVGIYNLAYQVSMIMNIFISAINNSLVPWTYEQLKNKKYNNIKSAANKLCIFVALLTSALIIVAPEFIMILGTSEYLDAVVIIPPVALSVYDYALCVYENYM